MRLDHSSQNSCYSDNFLHPKLLQSTKSQSTAQKHYKSQPCIDWCQEKQNLLLSCQLPSGASSSPVVWALAVVLQVVSDDTHGNPGLLLHGSKTRNVTQPTVVGGSNACFTTLHKVLLYTLNLWVVCDMSHSGLPNQNWLRCHCHCQLLLVVLQICGLCEVVQWRKNTEETWICGTAGSVNCRSMGGSSLISWALTGEEP